MTAKRFTTYERLENQPIAVIKKDNTRQPFDRNKILLWINQGMYKKKHKPRSIK